MASKNEKHQLQTLLNLQESLNELIRYTYLSGLQDGKELWNENEEVITKIGNDRISRILRVLNPEYAGTVNEIQFT